MSIASLQQDFRAGQVVATPRFFYQPDAENSSEGVISHYFGSSHPVARRLVIPIYNWVDYDTIAGTEEGRIYLRELSLMDDLENMCAALERVSGQSIGKFIFYTPDLPSRRNVPERAAGLGYNFDLFRVYGSSYINLNYGPSRGVFGSPAGNALENRLPQEEIAEDGTNIVYRDRVKEVRTPLTEQSVRRFFNQNPQMAEAYMRAHPELTDKLASVDGQPLTEEQAAVVRAFKGSTLKGAVRQGEHITKDGVIYTVSVAQETEAERKQREQAAQDGDRFKLIEFE